MDKFDEKVIGYESTKEILRQILDILKRPEVYKRKGISIPRGLLMESDPGLGKSLLASILMEESERKPFVFRKTSQENSFLDELRTVFAMAKEEAPSILLLEDLNLYVESTSPYAPEWACLQACIDDAKDTDLFVIATTNDTRYMPPSLLRPGRFDYVIYLQPPIGENAENIVSYYLRDKDLAEDVLISDIVKAMPKVSCATLETVMNLAALNSVYQGHEHIQKEDITEALLQVVYKLQKTDKETDSTELQKIAVHEAAHAVVGEVLHPGSIGIVTVRGNQGVIGGMANGCATYAQNEEEFLDEVTKTLAGRAGVSLIYGVMDIQASADIEQADDVVDENNNVVTSYEPKIKFTMSLLANLELKIIFGTVPDALECHSYEEAVEHRNQFYEIVKKYSLGEVTGNQCVLNKMYDDMFAQKGSYAFYIQWLNNEFPSEVEYQKKLQETKGLKKILVMATKPNHLATIE